MILFSSLMVKYLQKNGCIVAVTYVYVIPKFGYDQINIPHRKALYTLFL